MKMLAPMLDWTCWMNQHRPMGHVACRFIVDKCRKDPARAVRLFATLQPSTARLFLHMIENGWSDSYPQNRIRPTLP